MAVIYVTTLDSHDYYGPYANEAVAHAIMRMIGCRSYQLSTTLPEYAMAQLRKALPSR